MIDLDTIGYNMATPLKAYTGVLQLIEANQDIPPGKLLYPRITYNFIVRYNPEARQSLIAVPNVVASEEVGFDKDIEYTYYSNPLATLSINAYGKDVEPYINKAREWFQIPQLGPRFFEGYKAVVVGLSTTQDRKTYLETDFEERLGFDVILRFDEAIKIREKTIERVDITDMDGKITSYNL